MNKGLIHLYEGTGKGKTTAAMGLALRDLGADRNVIVIQFLKSTSSCEIPQLAKLGATIFRGQSCDKFVYQMTDDEKAETRKLQNHYLEKAMKLPCDLLVLDEVCAAVALDMVDEALVKAAVVNRPDQCEVVFTGREPTPWMVEMADYHTEMVCHKHPYDKKISARKGIEY